MHEGRSRPPYHGTLHIVGGLSTPQSHPCPPPSLWKTGLCPQHSTEVTLGSGGPVSTRLDAYASCEAWRARRAGQSSGEDQGLGKDSGAIRLGGVKGKRLQGEVLAATGCGHGARPPACHPRFPHGEGRKLPIPGPQAGGGEHGVGLGGGRGWARSGPHIFPKLLQASQRAPSQWAHFWNQEE